MWTSLNPVSTPVTGGNPSAHSAVGPSKHQAASVLDDNAAVEYVLDNLT